MPSWFNSGCRPPRDFAHLTRAGGEKRIVCVDRLVAVFPSDAQGISSYVIDRSYIGAVSRTEDRQHTGRPRLALFLLAVFAAIGAIADRPQVRSPEPADVSPFPDDLENPLRARHVHRRGSNPAISSDTF